MPRRAIDVSTGRRVWKFDTGEPERGGVSLTASGLGFAGGGDGLLHAFDLKTGTLLWKFQTGRQIASGPTIFEAGGKEHIAITVDVIDVSQAKVGGAALSADEAAALLAATGGINVGYRIEDLAVSAAPNGGVRVSGRAVRADGAQAPAVVLLSYRLDGRIVDATGAPVAGATVVTRTNDRDFWTFFPASDQSPADPVQFNVQVAVGRTNYTTGTKNPTFKRLSSASLDLALPAKGTVMAVPTSRSAVGAIYRGMLVGVSSSAGVVRPLSATWPDARGRFELILPRSVRGQVLRIWESDFQAYRTIQAVAGGKIDLGAWPRALSPGSRGTSPSSAHPADESYRVMGAAAVRCCRPALSPQPAA